MTPLTKDVMIQKLQVLMRECHQDKTGGDYHWRDVAGILGVLVFAIDTDQIGQRSDGGPGLDHVVSQWGNPVTKEEFIARLKSI